jgi:putative ABC transport system ATP-binding protein
LDTNIFRYVWRHSRGEQIRILLLILASMPFYFLSLDIPKTIVNDALQGRAFRDGRATARFFEWTIELPQFLGGHKLAILPGFDLDRVSFLMALSGLFLLLVVINGAFKYVINIRKGILGERLLRRMRFELFALLLRFRPEDIRAVKPSEAASMIKDEVEPIGAFVGDAFVQPAFLGAQALTAVVFILAQNILLGLIAVAIVLIQAVVIPALRREQIRLGRERQIASRQLAGRIGEVVQTAPVLHIHGTGPYSQAEIGDRLGHLFRIRADLYRRKFAVKFLNNFLAQVTPFFFYAFGGYFALKGTLDIGQLVAVITAYRDLPPPIKELIDWDLQRMDVTVKYQQVLSQFTVERQLPTDPLPAPEMLRKLDGPIAIHGLRLLDRRDLPLLDGVTLTIERPSRVAIVGTPGSGRDFLPKVLGRQIMSYQGTVRLGAVDYARLSDEVAGRVLAYAGPEHWLAAGSIRDNITYSLQRLFPKKRLAAGASPKGSRVLEEAELSGNPTVSAAEDWIDYEAAGVTSAEQLDGEIVRVLDVLGMREDIRRLGLNGRLGPGTPKEVLDRFIEARRAVRHQLDEHNLSRLVEPFDPSRYNDNATIGENLLFGVPVGVNPTDSELIAIPYLRSILEVEALVEPLTELGLRIAEITAEIFSGLPTGHPLFERYSFIRANEMEQFQRLIDTARQRGRSALPAEGVNLLMALAFGYIEPRHRLSLLDEAFKERILRARGSLMRYLPRQYAGRIEFYDPNRIMTSSPIRDNLLFGRVAFEGSASVEKVWEIVYQTVTSLGLDQVIYRLALDTDVGPGGSLLLESQRVVINLARCLIKRPEILILDSALSAFGPREAGLLLDRVRRAMADRTLIVALGEDANLDAFDQVIRFDGPRAVFALESEADARQ